ncbi:MAG TPA: hypothetical protein VKP30_03330, partial [Polyangiaceae bacterium]|nr:hypothetical protein [Polyangiaceae bacterium]
MHLFEERPFPRISILGISLAFSLAPSILRAQPAEPASSAAPLAPSDASATVTPASAVAQGPQGASSDADAKAQTHVATNPQPRLQSASQSPDTQDPATSETKP